MQGPIGLTAFITGGAGGIGLAIGKALARAGLQVTLADIDTAELAKVAEEFPGQVLTLGLDTTDRAAWRVARSAAEARFGPVDILVNNAGIAPDGLELADMAPETFDRLIGVNLTGVYNGVTTFAAEMRARRAGHIVNTASMAGLNAGANHGAYIAAKYAVVGLSEALRIEMAPHGVGVSVLCPGLVATRLFVAGADVSREAAARSKSRASMDPAEVAARVVEGVRANELYILTHPEYREAVTTRSAALSAAFDRLG
jgi:NAD(P)-dependent dehydrogenase (short-subunit alcohol dehydrogenase family)